MFTAAKLSEKKATIDDFVPTFYDHHSQVRKPINPNDQIGLAASDTAFDGERR